MKCNKNNNGGAVMSMGYSPEKRKMIFLGICIWIRFLMAFGVYTFYRRKELSYLIPLIAGYSIYINLKQIFNDKKKGKCVWWSRPFHILNGLTVLLVSVFKISLFNLHPNRLVSFLLLIDVLFGIVTSLIKKPWV